MLSALPAVLHSVQDLGNRVWTPCQNHKQPLDPHVQERCAVQSRCAGPPIDAFPTTNDRHRRYQDILNQDSHNKVVQTRTVAPLRACLRIRPMIRSPLATKAVSCQP